MGVPDVSALQRRVSPIHTVRGNRSSNSGLESVSQTCSLFPAWEPYPNLPYPPLRQQLHSHAHPFFTSTLMLWNPQTLLGLLSIRGAMRSSVQRISPSVSHPAHPVSPPPLHLHRSAPPADQHLLPVHPATPPPPLPHPIACLANLHRRNEENLETRVRLQLRRLRGRSLYLWIYHQLKNWQENESILNKHI